MQQASSAKLLGCMPRIQYKDAPRNLAVSNPASHSRCVGKTPSMQLLTWPRSSGTKRKSSCMAQVKAKDQKNCCLSTCSSKQFQRSAVGVQEFQDSASGPKVDQMQNWHGVLHGAILPPIEQYHLTTATRKKADQWIPISMMSFKFHNILPHCSTSHI